MKSSSQPIRSALLKSLCAFMLSFTLAISPAFALPKSPFLGFDDASAPKTQLLQPAEFESAPSLSLLPGQSLQFSPSPGGLYGLNTVSLFHAEPGVLFLLIIIPMYAPILAISGHLTGNYTVRNVGNILSYPIVLTLPVLYGAASLDQFPKLDLASTLTYIGFASSSIGLLLATIGQVGGYHRIRNAGNITYIPSIILSAFVDLPNL